MHKYLSTLLLLAPFFGFSQEKLSFQKTDSLTYQYYLQGEWKQMIGLTMDAFKQDIDSKYLRQRAGYAYYMTGDYTSAEIEYKKALEFDTADEITREYLYYCAANSGSEYSRFYAGNLSEETASKLGIKRINPVEMVDTEFNIKTNQTESRSNQIYYRFGINTELGYRLSLYQSLSYFNQTVDGIPTRQPEYLALLKWHFAPAWQLKTAYHYLYTNDGYNVYPGNLGFLALSSKLNRFTLEARGSILKSSFATTRQVGLQAGVVLPGKSNLYLTSALTGMAEDGEYRTIFSQSAGLKCNKKLWAEGNITLGNLKNYNTYNSLYVYNSVDPSVFRTGFSLFYFTGKHLSFTGNFTFDQQQIENSTTITHYYQYSFSGGIKWRL